MSFPGTAGILPAAEVFDSVLVTITWLPNTITLAGRMPAVPGKDLITPPFLTQRRENDLPFLL